MDCVSTHVAFGHSLDPSIFESHSDYDAASSASLADNKLAKRAKLE
jgi:hypothetical protein